MFAQLQDWILEFYSISIQDVSGKRSKEPRSRGLHNVSPNGVSLYNISADQTKEATCSNRKRKMSKAKLEKKERLDVSFALNSLQTRCSSRWRYLLEHVAKNYYEDVYNACGGEIMGSLLISVHSPYSVRASLLSRKLFEHPAHVTCKELALEVGILDMLW